MQPIKTIQADQLSLPIQTYRGDTLNIKILEAANLDNTPVDLSEYTIRMQLRRDPNSPQVIFELDESNFVLGKTDEQQSEFDELFLLLFPEDTAKLPMGNMVYDLELTDSGGEVNTPLVGTFINNPDVTR